MGISVSKKEKNVTFELVTLELLACENSRFSSHPLPGGMPAPERQKFHTDDVKSVQNLVRNSVWSM